MDPLNMSHQVYAMWAKPITNMDDLKDTLSELGWKIENQQTRQSGNLATWCAYMRSSTGAHCECNERTPQFVITPFDFDFIQQGSVEISIVGEANGQWWDLKCYSVPLDKVIPSLSKVCTGLLGAWNALPRAVCYSDNWSPPVTP